MISRSTGAAKILGLEKENVLSYSLSVTNGTGKNTLDIDRAKDLIGCLVIAPYNWVSIGASYHFAELKFSDVTVSKMDGRMRYCADLTVKKGNFIFPRWNTCLDRIKAQNLLAVDVE